jgi:hypothetical protein
VAEINFVINSVINPNDHGDHARPIVFSMLRKPNDHARSTMSSKTDRKRRRQVARANQRYRERLKLEADAQAENTLTQAAALQRCGPPTAIRPVEATPLPSKPEPAPEKPRCRTCGAPDPNFCTCPKLFTEADGTVREMPYWHEPPIAGIPTNPRRQDPDNPTREIPRADLTGYEVYDEANSGTWSLETGFVSNRQQQQQQAQAAEDAKWQGWFGRFKEPS